MKKNPDKSKVNRQYGDLGTPELKARHQVEIEVRERTANGESRTIGGRVKDQSPMDRYYSRKQLDPNSDKNYILFQSAERLASDFYYSGLMAKTTSSYEPRIKSVFSFMEHREDKLKSYKSAMKAIPDTLRQVLVHVCCIQGSAQDWAARNGHNKESGIVVLRLALTELAVHYGMLKKDLDTSSEHNVQIRSSLKL